MPVYIPLKNVFRKQCWAFEVKHFTAVIIKRTYEQQIKKLELDLDVIIPELCSVTTLDNIF